MNVNILRRASDEDKDGIPQVIISVRSGVVEVISKPVGVAVVLFDYDVDGAENVSKDSDGERCVISHWDAGRIEVSKKPQNHQKHEKGLLL